MSGPDHLLVVLAGFGAGLLTSTVGVASLLSFPILLAVGLPPVVANASNTVGLVPAGAGAALGFRRELRFHRGLTCRVVLLAGIAGGGGGAPAGPAAGRVRGDRALADPRHLRSRRGPAAPVGLARGPAGVVGTVVRPRHARPLTTFFVFVTGIYGGYFGAGAGVMMIATLALGLDVDFRFVAALRTLSVMASNVVAGAVFAVVADVDWSVVALLAVSSIGGGYLGARIARRLPATVLRIAVVLAGGTAAVVLLV
jgi:uncharacterized protein